MKWLLLAHSIMQHRLTSGFVFNAIGSDVNRLLSNGHVWLLIDNERKRMVSFTITHTNNTAFYFEGTGQDEMGHS